MRFYLFFPLPVYIEGSVKLEEDQSSLDCRRLCEGLQLCEDGGPCCDSVSCDGTKCLNLHKHGSVVFFGELPTVNAKHEVECKFQSASLRSASPTKLEPGHPRQPPTDPMAYYQSLGLADWQLEQIQSYWNHASSVDCRSLCLGLRLCGKDDMNCCDKVTCGGTRCNNLHTVAADKKILFGEPGVGKGQLNVPCRLGSTHSAKSVIRTDEEEENVGGPLDWLWHGFKAAERFVADEGSDYEGSDFEESDAEGSD